MAKNSNLEQALELLENQGEVDAAAKKFQAALDKGATGSNAAKARVGLARVKLAQGDAAGAEEQLQQALQADPQSGEAHTYLGVLAIRRRDLDAALAETRRGAELAPESFPARYNHANMLARASQLEAAIPEYRKAAELGPKSYQTQFELALACLALNQVADGVAALLKTLELNPGFVPAGVTMADLSMQVNKPEDAALTLMNVRQYGDNARDPVLLQRLVSSYRAMGDMGQALERAEEWAAAAPASPEALYELAMLRLLNGDIGGAEAEAKRLAAAFPKDWQGPFVLGMIYEAVKLRDQAKASYAAAAELGTGEWKPFNNLGKMLVEEEDRALVRQGMEKLQQARALSGDAPGVLFNMALAYAKLGEEDWAKKLAKQVAGHKAASEDLRRQAVDLGKRLGK